MVYSWIQNGYGLVSWENHVSSEAGLKILDVNLQDHKKEINKCHLFKEHLAFNSHILIFSAWVG